jgi:hypothetical protein
MKKSLVSVASLAAGASLTLGAVSVASARSEDPQVDPATKARSMLVKGMYGLVGGTDAGPDVIVGELMSSSACVDPSSTPALSPAGTLGNISAYGIGTSSCNIGTQNLNWISSTNDHPVIAQNMYRLKNGVLEQIGLSWLKHGFTALTCSVCSNEGYNCNGQGGSVLGVGCSDPYSASLNASQSNLGPRYQVNPSTGIFPYPYANFPNTTVLSKRLQVAHADMEAGINYFAEAMYVAKDDTAAGNNLNNASYRRATVNPSTHVFTLQDQTIRRKPAIYAWREYGGPGGGTDPSVTLNSVDVQGDGRFWVASKAWDIGGGMWHYEYAIMNLTSDRAAGSVTVPVPAAAIVANHDFHDVDYHSGEPYDTTDWSKARDSGNLVWTSPQTYGQNANSNALRWGTMYNFRFDCNRPPVQNGQITVGLFKPPTVGSPAASFNVGAWAPSADSCYADCNGDGVLGLADFGCFQTKFALNDPYADCNGDGVLGLADFGCFQTKFALGCP